MSNPALARYALPPEPRGSFCGPDGLWTRRDLVRLVVPFAVGAVGLFLGWYGSAKEAAWRSDSGWLVLAVVSVVVAGVGLVWWLVVGRVRLAIAQRGVRTALVRRRLGAPTIAPRAIAAAVEEPQSAMVTVAGMRRRHRPDCLLVVGKPAVPTQADVSGLAPCGVCRS